MADGKSNNSDDAIWIIMVLIILMVVLMFLINKYYWIFNAIYGSIAWIHVYPVAMLGKLLPFLENIPLIGPYLITPCIQANDFLSSGNFSQMTFEGQDSARKYVMNAAGRVAFIIYTPFLVRAMLYETDVHVDQKYKKRHSLESMLFEQAKSFPTIRMFKHMDPIEHKDLLPSDFADAVSRQISASKGGAGDLISGVKVMLKPSGFTRAINPEEWLVSNGLVMDMAKYKKIKAGMFEADERDFYFEDQWDNLSIASISEILEDQLITPWAGPQNLPPHLKALFAVMTLFFGYDLKGGNKLLDDLGFLAEKSVMTGTRMRTLIEEDKDLMGRVDEIISSKQGKQMNYIASKHAWVESALPTLLRAARFERGVLASASFIWLKREDRTSWYILNSTGNDVVNIEAAGAMAHNRAELDFGFPLMVPHMFQAARSILHDYLDRHPDRAEIKKKRRESRRSLNEQIRLMSIDANIMEKRIESGGMPDE